MVIKNIYVCLDWSMHSLQSKTAGLGGIESAGAKMKVASRDSAKASHPLPGPCCSGQASDPTQ